jgi:hypothetical protein
MRLTQAGNSVYMINFGQPRTGNDIFAAFSNTHFTQQYRVVHYQDQVPHIPPQTKPLNYTHVRTEAYEDSDGSVRLCNSSGEDPTCADQWALTQTNWDDHDVYLGVPFSCGAMPSTLSSFL